MEALIQEILSFFTNDDLATVEISKCDSSLDWDVGISLEGYSVISVVSDTLEGALEALLQEVKVNYGE